MSDQVVPIYPMTTEWNAWLKHLRGTKAELAMLACLVPPVRPWLAPSAMPPAMPVLDAGNLRKEAPAAEVTFPERPGIGDADFEASVSRLEARDELRRKESAEEKKRRKLDKKIESRREKAIAAVLENRRPIVEDSDDFGVVRVEDPNETQELVQVGNGPPMRVAVKGRARYRLVALRDDPVGQMAKRGQLGAPEICELRLAAARRWQSLYERAELSALRAFDPSHERVDTGGAGDIETTSRLDAIKRLGELAALLGMRSEQLVRRVLGEKMTLRAVADANGLLGGSKSSEEKILASYGERFRDSLDDLGQAFNLTVEGKGGRRGEDRFDAMARFRGNPGLRAAIGRSKLHR